MAKGRPFPSPVSAGDYNTVVVGRLMMVRELEGADAQRAGGGAGGRSACLS